MSNAIMPVYSSAPVAPVRGEGIWLYEADGTRWLDCVGGVATNALGHCHPKMVAALTSQAERLWHVSNALVIPGQQRLAEALTGACFADRVFFSNTGSEAVESAIKTARRHHAVAGRPDRVDVIGFRRSFHGRTYAAINAAGNPAYLDGFGPALPGYVQVAFDDGEAIEAAIARSSTAAVIVEPVQGEGGGHAFEGDFLRNLRRLCSRHGVLLIYDEVQSGMGRTGKLFAHQWFEDAQPDIMAIAKALGAGFPVAACLATESAASGMVPGVHGSTFGGNPLAMAVALAAFELISDPNALAHVQDVSNRLRTMLAALGQAYPDIVEEVRGKGLLVAVKLVPNNRAFMTAARDHRILLSGCGDNCIRLLPSLLLSYSEAEDIIDRLVFTCDAMRAAQTI